MFNFPLFNKFLRFKKMVKINIKNNEFINIKISFKKKELYNERTGLTLFCIHEIKENYDGYSVYRSEGFSNKSFKYFLIELKRKNTKLETTLNDYIFKNQELIKKHYLNNDFNAIVEIILNEV